MTRVGILVALLALSCGGTIPPALAPKPFGQDLVEIVPTGAELVIDVDLQQLRTWDAMDRVLELLPPAALARLNRLGDHWMNDIDALVLASWRGERGSDSIIVIRGDLPDDKLPVFVDDGSGVAPEQRRLFGKLLYETHEESALRLAPRVFVLGSPVDIRRVADCVRGDLPNVRDAPADKLLRAAIAHAPTAKTGRPAVIGGAIGGPLLQERMQGAGLPERPPRWASLAVAVGDGIDAVLILGMPTVGDATNVREQIDDTLRQWKTRPLVRLLHVEELFDVELKVKEDTLHLTYRVGGVQLDRFLSRMNEGKKALENLRSKQNVP